MRKLVGIFKDLLLKKKVREFFYINRDKGDIYLKMLCEILLDFY